MNKTEVIETVPPVIDADEFTGFNTNMNLAFVIGDFKVHVNWEKPYEDETELYWRLSTSVNGFYSQTEINDGEPTAGKAQSFLYETILKGIFEEKALQVVAR
jgi:hypothetical protein